MATVTISGNALVIKSAVKFAELKAVSKYRPEALTLREGGKADGKPVFVVGFSSGDYGSLSDFGATFNNEPDATGAATITLTAASFGENPAETVADVYGGALVKLAEIEKNLPKAVAEIEKQKEDVMKTITVQ